MIVEWDPSRPKKRATESILAALRNGDIIAYPTDTFYGLGCDLFNIKAIRRLYEIRGLNDARPLSVIFKDLKEISTFAVMSDFAFRVLKASLPGPYTFILKARRIIPRLMMSGKKEVGVRMPNHPVPLALTRLLERPLINTSAKSPTMGLLTDPRKIDRYLKGAVSLVIDGGLIAGEPSTVISLVDDEVKVLREGKGPIKDLLAG
jgi:tRNA threonylcarbamoyl adenosine modification protein (Sua5/YciO/YrdC/YwlC family)